MHSTSAALSQRSSGVSYTNCTPASCRFPCSSTSQTFLQAVNIFHSSTRCQILPRLATSFLTRYAFNTTYRGFTQAAQARLPPPRWPALEESLASLAFPSKPPGHDRNQRAPCWDPQWCHSPPRGVRTRGFLGEAHTGAAGSRGGATARLQASGGD